MGEIGDPDYYFCSASSFSRFLVLVLAWWSTVVFTPLLQAHARRAKPTMNRRGNAEWTGREHGNREGIGSTT